MHNYKFNNAATAHNVNAKMIGILKFNILHAKMSNVNKDPNSRAGS